jgi:endoglucanase
MFKVKRFLVMVTFFICLPVAAFGQDQVRFRGTMISPFVQASDLSVLGTTWNANFIRWQLNLNWNEGPAPSQADYDIWLETALESLDQMLPVCQKAGLKVLVDLHTLPGGRNANNELLIFKEAKYQTQFLQVWQKIAQRYSNNKTVWGFDLVNEPVVIGNPPAGVMSWYDLEKRAAQIVRSVDSTHAIVFEPNNWGNPTGFIGLVPLPSSISNVVYSVHMYSPHKFTHQRLDNNLTLRYPGVVDHQMWDKTQLKAELKPVLDFQKKYGVPIMVTEFSAIRWAPAGSAYRYLKDLIEIFEGYGWSWTYHAFREFEGWSTEYGEDKNNKKPALTPTNREKLLRYYFGKNVHY